MPNYDNDEYSMQLLSALSEFAAGMPVLNFTPNPTQSRNAARAMNALICRRLSMRNEAPAHRSAATYEWRGGVFNSRNIADRDYFWTNMRRGVAKEMHDEAVTKPAAYLFACAKPGDTAMRLWAIPEPILHDSLRSLVFEQKEQKYTVEISTKKQRIERYEASPDLYPYFRTVELSPDEALILEKSREADEKAKEKRRRQRELENDDRLIEELAQQLDDDGEFDPAGTADARDHILASIVRRRGQPAFRDHLLSLYNMRCAISGCDVVPVLEAAHITPYLGPHTNRADNGLLLRADLHTLFDLKLIAIDEDSMTLLVSTDLNGTCYEQFRGVPLALPPAREDRPSYAALEKHREGSGL
jgi:predicted restriction endonuclease